MAELTDEQWDEFTDSIGENTEATVLLTEMFKKGVKAAGGSLDGLSDTIDESADSFDEMNEEVRGSTEELELFKKSAQKLHDAWKVMKTQTAAVTQAFAGTTSEILASGESFGVMRKFIDPIAEIMGALVAGIGAAVAGFVSLGSIIPIVGGALKGLGSMIANLSAAAGKAVTALFKFGANLVIDGIEQLWSMFEGAASAGVLFANGLTEMNKQRGDLSLTTQEYTEVVKNSRNQLSIFGGSVGEGAKRLAAVGKESKVFNEELRAMGITYKEQAENTADFMASLQKSGQLRLMNDKQIAVASAEYQRNLSVISSLTGKSIETMKQERDESLKNMAFQAKLAQMKPEIRLEMEKALMSMPEGMKQAFQESVIFGNVMTDTGAIVSGAAKYIEDFANSVADGSSTNTEAFQKFRDELKENAPELRKRLGDLAAAGMAELLGVGNPVTASINKFADSLYKEISRAENNAKDSVVRMLSTGEQQEASVKQILSGLDAQREMQDQLLKIIVNDTLPIATKMFELLSVTMSTGLKNFVEFIRDPVGYAKAIEDSIKNEVAELSIGSKFSNAVIGFFAGEENKAAVGNAIGKGVHNLLVGVGLSEGFDATGPISRQVEAKTGKTTQTIHSDRVASQIESGGDISAMSYRASFNDDYVNNIEKSKQITGTSASRLADRKIAEMEAQILELQKPENATAGGFFSSSSKEQIEELNESIKFMGEQQKITNATLKEANKQRDKTNRTLDEAVN